MQPLAGITLHFTTWPLLTTVLVLWQNSQNVGGGDFVLTGAMLTCSVEAKGFQVRVWVRAVAVWQLGLSGPQYPLPTYVGASL